MYLISYDIGDDRRRGRVFEMLKDVGRHVQLSVFECDLTEAQIRDLVDRIEWEVMPEDSCRIYRFCGACAGMVKHLGRQDTADGVERWIV